MLRKMRCRLMCRGSWGQGGGRWCWCWGQRRDPHFVRACAVKMHLDMSQEPLLTEIYGENAAAQNRGADFVRACAVETHIHMSQEPFIRKFTGKMPRPRTAAQTFCEPAQSKHTSTCHKSHLYGNLQEKCNGPEPRRRLSASLPSRNTHPHVTRAIYTEIYRKNATAQNRGADFLRACAVETHIHMSQEPLYTEIHRKRAAAQNRGPHFVRACTVKTHINMSQNHFIPF